MFQWLRPSECSFSHLQQYVGDDDQEGVGEVEEEPDLHWLDVGGAGEAGGHREVDRGQDHHAGSNKIRVK